MCLYAIFVNLTKDFDTVIREALWVILGRLSCPAKFTTFTRLLRDDMAGEVLKCCWKANPLEDLKSQME